MDNLTQNIPVELVEKFKFKQHLADTKRKLTVNDYSDSTLEFIFKQKGEGTYEITGGFRLSYAATMLLYNSLGYMLEENQRTFH